MEPAGPAGNRLVEQRSGQPLNMANDAMGNRPGQRATAWWRNAAGNRLVGKRLVDRCSGQPLGGATQRVTAWWSRAADNRLVSLLSYL